MIIAKRKHSWHAKPYRLPFNPFYDDNEDEYDFAEVTEENCWIIKNLRDGRYFTASEEFMQEYELLED